MDGLHSDGNLTKDPQLVPGKEELGVLQVCHLDAEVPHKVVVNQGAGGCRQVWGNQTSKGSSFDTKDEFFFIVSVPVTRGRVNVTIGHHFENVVGSAWRF